MSRAATFILFALAVALYAWDVLANGWWALGHLAFGICCVLFILSSLYGRRP